MGDRRGRVDEAVTAAAQAWVDARVQYWKQWGIAADYPVDAQTEVRETIRRHRRRPDILAQKMERLTMRLDGAYIGQIKERVA
jgi:hypothetical protein